jgi:ATP-dependent helicase/nuclease subunit A
MTIHKAKGLGFPVVILLLYGDSPHGFAYTLLREESKAATLVKITQDIVKRDPSLKELYDEEEVREKVDRLNGLYVALTRARRELYVIGVKRDRDTFPFDLLPSTGFGPSADKGAAAPSAAPAQTNAPLSHQTRLVLLSFERGRLGREERRRGELAHRMLELLGEAPTDFPAALAAAAERAAREARLDPAETAGLSGLLLRMVKETEAAACFAPAPGRIVLTEQEFCDKAGRLLRMDRVVVDPAAVTVVDFKTGAEDPAAHEAQLRDYMGILADVYPGRSVAGLAAYIDLGVTRRIG